VHQAENGNNAGSPVSRRGDKSADETSVVHQAENGNNAGSPVSQRGDKSADETSVVHQAENGNNAGSPVSTLVYTPPDIKSLSWPGSQDDTNIPIPIQVHRFA